MIQAGWCGSKLRCLLKSFIVNAYEGNQCETIMVQRLLTVYWMITDFKTLVATNEPELVVYINGS